MAKSLIPFVTFGAGTEARLIELETITPKQNNLIHDRIPFLKKEDVETKGSLNVKSQVIQLIFLVTKECSIY